jgi:hypothetical protein
MSQQDFDASRRRFFGQVAVAGAGVAAGLTLAPQAFAQSALPELVETDPTAAALGYKSDSTTVDAAKYPNHKPEQACAGCNLVQGAAGDALRPCAIFPGKAVNAKGWCAAFVPKAS